MPKLILTQILSGRSWLVKSQMSLFSYAIGNLMSPKKFMVNFLACRNYQTGHKQFFRLISGGRRWLEVPNQKSTFIILIRQR